MKLAFIRDISSGSVPGPAPGRQSGVPGPRPQLERHLLPGRQPCSRYGLQQPCNVRVQNSKVGIRPRRGHLAANVCHTNYINLRSSAHCIRTHCATSVSQYDAVATYKVNLCKLEVMRQVSESTAMQCHHYRLCKLSWTASPVSCWGDQAQPRLCPQAVGPMRG